MLRKILMALGLVVAFLPYAGIPRAIDALIYPIIGLSIFFLLIFSKKPKIVVRPNMDVAVSMQKAEVVKPSVQIERPEDALSVQENKENVSPQPKIRIRTENTHVRVRHDQPQESKISVLRHDPVQSMDHEKAESIAVVSQSVDVSMVQEKKPARRRKKLSEVLSDTGQQHPPT